MSNHLGNVLVTISDKKIGVDSDNDGVVNYYNADVVTANDYYPFGSQMPGRKYSQPNSKYRYGFNGQENDKDISEGLTTAMYWEYDSRIGRRWNADPVQKVWESPYMCFSGNPIWYSDLLGNTASKPNKGNEVDPKRKKGYNVFIVPTKEMRDNDAGGAYKADYKTIKKFEKNNPNNVIIIESDDPEKAIYDLQGKLGKDGYVKNLLIDYHAGFFGEQGLNSKGAENAMRCLADGYIGQGSTIYLGNCWAGGGEKSQGFTTDYCNWSDKATTYGGKTEAKAAGFRVFGDFTRMSWTLNLSKSGKSDGVKETERQFAGQHGVSFYSTFLKAIVSMDIKNTVKFNADGAIMDKSPKSLQQRFENNPTANSNPQGKVINNSLRTGGADKMMPNY